jgi:hypothetical protein
MAREWRDSHGRSRRRAEAVPSGWTSGGMVPIGALTWPITATHASRFCQSVCVLSIALPLSIPDSGVTLRVLGVREIPRFVPASAPPSLPEVLCNVCLYLFVVLVWVFVCVGLIARGDSFLLEFSCLLASDTAGKRGVAQDGNILQYRARAHGASRVGGHAASRRRQHGGKECHPSHRLNGGGGVVCWLGKLSWPMARGAGPRSLVTPAD